MLCGFGFGLAIAPVNAALLAWTRAEVHGIASALLVVARMVGMLVGISALTTIGLRRFYAESADMPAVSDVCKPGKVCDEYLDLLKDVGVTQTQTIFIGGPGRSALTGRIAVGTHTGSSARRHVDSSRTMHRRTRPLASTRERSLGTVLASVMSRHACQSSQHVPAMSATLVGHRTL